MKKLRFSDLPKFAEEVSLSDLIAHAFLPMSGPVSLHSKGASNPD